MEDLASKATTNISKSFSGTSTAAAAFSAEGKTGAPLVAASTRDDIRLKYGKYGKTESLGDGSGGCFATMSQLAYTSPVEITAVLDSRRSSQKLCGADMQSIQIGGAKPLKTSDCIWTGSNSGDRKVPKTVLANRLAEERRQKLAEEASTDKFTTAEKVHA